MPNWPYSSFQPCRSCCTGRTSSAVPFARCRSRFKINWVLTTQLEQNLRGARIVKAFSQEPAEIGRFKTENEKWFALSAESARVQAVNAPLLDLIANFGTVIIFWYGGWLVIQQQMTLGELVAFTTYLAMLLRPINLIGRIIPILAIAASAAERIFTILDTETEIKDRPGALPAPRLAGRVCFENVSFVYAGSRTVLHDIDSKPNPARLWPLSARPVQVSQA